MKIADEFGRKAHVGPRADPEPGAATEFDFEEALATWHAVGQTLREARLRLGISMREAARRAGLSDGAWRHLEAGEKVSYGTTILPNPRPENLIAAAKAVDLNPAVLFDKANRNLPEEYKYLASPRPEELTTDDGRSIPLDGLSDADLELVVALVERLKSDG